MPNATVTSAIDTLLRASDQSAARVALGLGSAALAAMGDFDAAGAAAGAQAASQPADSDLAAIALLTTTSFGRGLLELANAAAARTTLGATIAQLETDAAITPAADGTYVTGLGITVNGSIAIKNGIITTITPAS